MERHAHSDPHEERLRQFVAGAFVVQEVAVVEGLQAQVGEVQVAFGAERGTEPVQVEVGELGREVLQFDTARDEGAQVFGVAPSHVGVGGLIRVSAEERQGFPAQLVQQEPGADIGVVGVGFNERARRHDQASSSSAGVIPG